ncbi:malonyl-ACP O-methyltransferase BioC [Endozoicomonas sp. ONNA2]|uniref:malonyl-ACP O-methyltransferase BioC n=1 Tax=Endozoicomonas sp. ONNA2 TaxID=2828741 RepID=UPI0021478B2F|nr:malonyl-ACP O-methyltransferase BioC [Endozoicomonas sp. ONNA2]
MSLIPVHNQLVRAGLQPDSTDIVTTGRANARAKQRIADNFSRAADGYDQAAILQKRVAARTMLGLPAQLISEPPGPEPPGAIGLQASQCILDLGTGTGLHSLTLAERYDDALVIGMDLAMGMLQFARHQNTHPRVAWCSGDIEAMPLQASVVDLVYSSLAIQWCSFARVLCQVSRVLKPGGTFVFSTLAQGSLKELDRAWCRAGAKDRVNRFDTFATQKQCLKASDLVCRAFSLKPETLLYPDVITLLRSLKALGVNTVLAGKGGLLTRRKLEVLKQAYEKKRQPEGLPLTYQVIYGVLQKPDI